MTKPMEKITAHFRSKITGEMDFVEVPEWDLKIYFKKTSTLQEQTKVIELAQKGSTVEALVETLIMKARNEDGSKMFKPADKVVLMNEGDPDTIIRVVGQITRVVDADEMAEVEKN